MQNIAAYPDGGYTLVPVPSHNRRGAAVTLCERGNERSTFFKPKQHPRRSVKPFAVGIP
jgi:hypothetical protein